MLKLKHLFQNKDLTQMILSNWDYDLDNPHHLEYYGISSNAVQWCKNCGETFFLRFAPVEEKFKEDILAELDFLRYLHDNNYPAVETILSKSGNELEAINTPWGKYYAVAFKKAPGKQVSSIALTEDIIFNIGKALGRLHKLSSTYKPSAHKRRNWMEIMEWIGTVLMDFPEEAAAKSELKLLRSYISALDVVSENYGLIHYDFEPDNLFFEETTGVFTPIDFDDSIYSWYAMDIEQSLDSIRGEIDESMYSSATNSFLAGYRTEYEVSDDMLTLLPVFRRYVDLYGYVRVLRSVEEKWSNEPEWLASLRQRLSNVLCRRSENFGKNL